MRIAPITPDEAKKLSDQLFPDWMIKAVNGLVVKNMRGNKEFTIKQKDIMTDALALAPEGTTSNTVYENGWMDFESIYRSHGWEVKYTSPAMDESFEEYFSFKPESGPVNRGL